MKPYYEEDGITIYCGDCRDVLPHLPKVDLVLTDPPYGINYQSGGNSSSSISSTGKRQTAKVIGDDQPFHPELFIAAGDVCAFTGAHHFAERLSGGSYHVWNKRGSYKPIDQADGDLIWISGVKKPLRILDVVWRGLCRHTEVNKKILHPTQKPIILMQLIMGLVGEPQTILDPFMGSGTTLVAAKQLGRKAIGIELEERYCEIAVQRLRQGVLNF